MLRSFSSNQIKRFGSYFIDCKQFSKATVNLSLNDDWKKLAEKQLKGKSVDGLVWKTPEVF